MDEKSRSDELQAFCMVLSKADCHEIFNGSLDPPPKYNVWKVIDDMLSNALNKGDCKAGKAIEIFKGNLWQHNDQLFGSDEDKFLNILAMQEKRGIVLHAFLVAVKTQDVHFFNLIQQKIRDTVNRMTCEPVDERVGANYGPVDGEIFQNNWTDPDVQLLMCPKCKKVMTYPMLLHCLHSCCGKCKTSDESKVCAGCRDNVEHSPSQPNYHLHFKIACATSRQLSSESGSRFIRMCKIHNAQLMLWCNDCVGYRCQTYTSHKCNLQNPKHDVLQPEIVAGALQSFLEPFDTKYAGNAAETTGSAMKNALDEQLKLADTVLEMNRKRLLDATEHAFTDARQKMNELHSEQHAVVDVLTMQMHQACLYAKSIRNEYWHIMDQRKLLIKQLALLLVANREPVPSLTKEQCQSFDLPFEYKAVESNRIVKSLVIRCLDDNYDFKPVTKELIGQPDLSIPDYPIVSDTHCPRQPMADLRMIEEMTSQLNDYRLRLEDMEKKYKEAVAKASSLEMEQNVKEQERVTEAESMEVQQQVNEDVINDEQTRSSGKSGESNGYSQACCYESVTTCDFGVGSELQSKLRKLTPKLVKSLRGVNVPSLATIMWATKNLNDEELDDIKSCQASHGAASKLLDYVHPRGEKCIRTLVHALRCIDMDHLADEILRADAANVNISLQEKLRRIRPEFGRAILLEHTKSLAEYMYSKGYLSNDNFLFITRQTGDWDARNALLSFVEAGEDNAIRCLAEALRYCEKNELADKLCQN